MQEHSEFATSIEIPPEVRRLVIAEALAAQHENRGWTFSPDNSVPETAQMYVVYDGAEIIAGGCTPLRAQEAVAQAKMPIVFYRISNQKES